MPPKDDKSKGGDAPPGTAGGNTSGGNQGSSGGPPPRDDSDSSVLDADSHAPDVLKLLKPGDDALGRRVILPGSTGVANHFQALKWIKNTLLALEALFEKRVSSATGEVARNMFDTYLMFLGGNGTTRKVDENANIWIVMNNGEPEEVPVSVFQDPKLSPRQIGRFFADRIGDLAVEFKITYAWGKQRGVKDQDRRLSHDCAEHMKDLDTHAHDVIARCKSAAIASAPVDHPLNSTASAFLAGLEQWSTTGRKRVGAADLDRMLESM